MSHEEFEEQYEVVPVDEPSIEDYPPKPTEEFDAFGAPIKKPVRVLDGVRDTARR